MTLKQIYEALLIELDKVNAPSFLLGDFNYYVNKAVMDYLNKRYSVYDVNQQTTDDLRVLKATAFLKPELIKDSGNVPSSLYENIYQTTLPSDYYHCLNCVCGFKADEDFNCYKKDSVVYYAARRLTSDSWGVVMSDYYSRPTVKQPYYYIHNINTSNTIPTNPVDSQGNGTDMNYVYLEEDVVAKDEDEEKVQYPLVNNLPRVLTTNASDVARSVVNRDIAFRYGNPSKVRMEIRYGDDPRFQLVEVLMDYLKSPQYLELTRQQLDLIEDTSQIIEFPDYVCYQIINELVHIFLESNSDPRLQTHIPVSQSIPQPALGGQNKK